MECFYCKKSGHKISECPSLKENKFKSVGLVVPSKSRACDNIPVADIYTRDFDHKNTDYSPFITLGSVSLPGHGKIPVRILRDTGAAQSFLLEGVVPLSEKTATGTHVLVRGIEMGFLDVPLHTVNLSSGLVTGEVIVGVRSSLPVPEVEFILGNDLAGGNVWEHSRIAPPPVVISAPLVSEGPDECLKKFPHVFPACAITRARAKQLWEDEDQSCLSRPPELASPAVEVVGNESVSPADCQPDKEGVEDSLAMGFESDQGNTEHAGPNSEQVAAGRYMLGSDGDRVDSALVQSLFKVSREDLIGEQRADESINKLFVLVEPEGGNQGERSWYLLQEELLRRKWIRTKDGFSDTFVQVVVPEKFREAVLELSHGQHGGSVVSTVASQQEGPGFASRSFQVVPGPFCVEFACSPRACVGLLRVLRFPPPS